ncbi:M14 family metallocarboxypeptidase [Polaribacter litorisediminis]|uniref:M14 family metallopeptidase n=1 Tax=Polaribacter litorisediminis TaxID=1908341 RepID=UPI001CBEE840|nr:M14 family metallocarboxypeptidase [Polaribacter litorisediminis]UAM97914.1 M14 family metallocarboxypeptidase [Polaribacter litorisediminis]
MIKLGHILLLFISASVFGQLNPQTKSVTKKIFPDFEEVKNVTPALKKEKGFTTDEELYAFLEGLAKNHPNKVQISYIGESQKGKKIPFVKMTNPNQKEKIKVFFQGGLHGNELASTEGVLYVMHQLLNDKNYTHLLDDIDLAVIPMANIDGYLKESRYAANGLDLNRDQTKLMAKESVILKQAFSNFNPEVALDFHEYTAYRRDFSKLGNFGVANIFDVMFLYSGNLNVPKNLREFTEKLFVKNASDLLNENKLRNHPYISTTKYRGDIHFNQGSISARSSATNYALTNTISSLVEIRGVNLGRTSFKRRIQSIFLVATSYLKTAIAHKKELKEVIQKAIYDEKEIVVTSKRKVYTSKLQMLDLDTEKIIELEVTKRDAWLSSAVLIRPTPKAYLIDASQKEIIEKLKTLGAKIKVLEEDKKIEVEIYKIIEYKRNSKKYEQMNLQKVKTEIHKQQKVFAKGTFMVSLNQKNANLIVEVLEPEAPNSFVSFGVLPTEKDAILPIYRILK